MSSHNPRALGVRENQLVNRSSVDTTTHGEALVTKVVALDGLEMLYTGADEGTGDVTIKLPVIPASAGRTFTAVVVDNYGRVVGGTEGSITGDYILLDPAMRQAGGFSVDTGDVTTLTVLTLNATTFNVNTLNLLAPLPISSGGTGTDIADPHKVFIGPTNGAAGAPSFRLLIASDIPEIAFSKITAGSLPTTLNGYGISDAYTKGDSDIRYAPIVHTHSGYEPAIIAGTAAQYYRGDKTFQTLNTDAVVETVSHKYFSDSLARLALSQSGTNITYDNTTGVIGFTSTPGFTQVTVSDNPTLDTHVVSKLYLETALSNHVRYSTDMFVVSNVNTKDYTLAHEPIANSLVVSLNGLVETDYTIVSSTTLRLSASITLGVGDVINAVYNY